MKVPFDVFRYICSFMGKCECCQTLHESKILKSCCVCKRFWCNECRKKCNYLTMAYFETYVTICKYCLSDLRRPHNTLC